MKLKKRKFTREFKIQVCREIELGFKTKTQISREHQLSEGLAGKWLSEYRKDPLSCFTNSYHNINKQEARISQLEAALGRVVLENQLLKKAIKHFEKISKARRFTK